MDGSSWALLLPWLPFVPTWVALCVRPPSSSRRRRSAESLFCATARKVLSIVKPTFVKMHNNCCCNSRRGRESGGSHFLVTTQTNGRQGVLSVLLIGPRWIQRGHYDYRCLQFKDESLPNGSSTLHWPLGTPEGLALVRVNRLSLCAYLHG